MAIQPPNDGLVTETAQQYFQGSQGFKGDVGNTTGQSFFTSFDKSFKCILHGFPS